MANVVACFAIVAVAALAIWRAVRRDELRVPVRIEVEHEDDGRWFAAVQEIPGLLAYGPTREEAIRAALALALRVLADRVERGEPIP